MQTTQHPAADAITAGLRRANRLANCEALAPLTRNFWYGYSKGLADLQSGALDALALRDETLQNIEAGAQRAWASLPISAEACAVPDVSQGLAAQSTKVSADAITQRDFNTAEQLENSKVAIVGLDDKHAAHGMNVCDGTGLHDAFLVVEKTIVAQGGAA